MGVAIARELYKRGAEVQLVMGPSNLDFSVNGISLTRVNTAAEMYKACQDHFESADITIMAAAVADYSPMEKAKEKIKKKDEKLLLELGKTTDILKSLGEKKRQDQVIVGFALETEHEKENTIGKMKNKNADLMVLNSLNDAGAGFGHDTNKITIFEKSGEEMEFNTKSKADVAKDIVDTLIRFYYA
jgi:phosphopantothenoylcysteine decarboxylase/phosphopantothenate--cysteine ligase